MSLAIDSLLEPIAPDSPCGQDLSSSTESYELDDAMRGKPEVQYGNMTQQAEEPNWSDVEKQCEKYFTRSKDLRVITYLAIVWLCRRGYPGFSDGLKLLEHTIGNYWDGVYPQLDPEDDNDPMERRNIIESISPSEDTVDEFLRVRDRLYDTPLCESPRSGPVSLRQILRASGELTPPADGGNQMLDANMINGAFDDVDAELLQEQESVLAEVCSSIDALETKLNELIPDASPSFSSLRKWITRASKELARHLVRRGLGSDEVPMDADDSEMNAGGGKALSFAQPAAVAVSGSIQNHDDVRKTLDLLCEFFEKREPSSPVPLLLKRARVLVGLGFTDIIQNLSPDAIHQINTLRGPQDSD